MIVTININEINVLYQQDPATRGDGGFQKLLIDLQERINRNTGEIDLTPDDLEKIPRYAFDYGNGGWEKRLVDCFGRVLGPNLGR